MKYFAKIKNIYQEKNNAHKELQQYAVSVDATLLVSEKSKTEFITGFKQKINAINVKHNRCKNIELSHWDISGDEDTSLSVTGNFSMIIYQVKEEF